MASYNPPINNEWFIPGDGIERAIISSSIQRYLGNDATVRPGIGKDEYQGVQGFYIYAYRNLTSAQQGDLREASRKYRNDIRKQPSQPSAPPARMTGDYGRTTYPQSGYSQPPNPYANTVPPSMGRPGGDSPNGMDTGYPGAGPRDRYPVPPSHRMDEMDVDMAGGYAQPPRPRYDDEPRRYAEPRPYEQERPAYHDARPQYGADPYGYRPQTGTGNFGADPRMTQGMDYRDNRGAAYGGNAPGYSRPAEPYGYPAPPATAPPATHIQPPYNANGGYQPPPGPPPGRMEQRPDTREPRYASGPSNDFTYDRDATRYAYPSPPVTVVGARDGLPSAPSPRCAATIPRTSGPSLTLLNSGYPGPGLTATGNAMYSYESRAGTTATTGAYPPGVYDARTSPSTLPKPGPRRGEGSEDGEPPRNRPRYM